MLFGELFQRPGQLVGAGRLVVFARDAAKLLDNFFNWHALHEFTNGGQVSLTTAAKPDFLNDAAFDSKLDFRGAYA